MGRQVNPEKAEYMKAVNGSMAATFGVGFSEVFKDIDPNLAVMSKALSDGTYADDCADQIGKSFGFVKAEGEISLDVARSRNIRSAALANFARESEGWSVGGDGAIYKADGDGVFKVEAVTARSGAWGFGTLFSHGADVTVDATGRAIVSGGEFERVGAGLDIVDAIAAYENRLEASQGIGLR